jgi:hypothetical protein
MAIVSPPAALMTETAAGLLAAAEQLGLRPDVVETTGDTPLGLGFKVPDAVYELWLGPGSPDPGDGTQAAAQPVAEPKPKGKRGPAKPATDGPEV